MPHKFLGKAFVSHPRQPQSFFERPRLSNGQTVIDQAVHTEGLATLVDGIELGIHRVQRKVDDLEKTVCTLSGKPDEFRRALIKLAVLDECQRAYHSI